ncbi:MAG: hypothetical protein LC745_00290 [Planctomycetia bacterium]|nr:hypothetical protein [Planctomycetia bacterium]
MEAKRVLTQTWRRTEAVWETAEAADLAVTRSKQQGIDARGVARTAFHAWNKAIASFERAERLEAAWTRAHTALDLFGPTGQLNTRAHAEAEIALALNDLTGSDWSKVRNFLNDPRSLSFLDRMHRRLESAEPRRDWREAVAWRWWLRHRRCSSPDRLTTLVQSIGRDRVLTSEEAISYERVASVLKVTFRASSAVECMNSVLRMQQSRHKTMSQPMLDLKRLYWNCHEFGSGPRKDVSPYRRLGLQLPTFDFWTLLQADPAELTQELSMTQSTE